MVPKTRKTAHLFDVFEDPIDYCKISGKFKQNIHSKNDLYDIFWDKRKIYIIKYNLENILNKFQNIKVSQQYIVIFALSINFNSQSINKQ